MEFGFTYKGRRTKDFGATSRTKSRALLPETKRYVYDAPAKDGSYDFTEANEFDRAFYKDRVFDMTLTVTASSLIELSRKATKIAAWLTGAGTLVFDDAPLVMWQARAASDVAYTQEKSGTRAELSVVFQSSAIGRASFTTGEGIRLGDGVPLDSDIPLDMSAYFEKQLAHGENEIDFVNLGDFYVRPVLRFCFGDAKITLAEQTVTGAETTAAQRNITVTYGDSKIMLEGIAADAVVDLEKCVVKDASGNSLMNKMQGRFFELPPGRSTLSVYVSAPCTLIIDYAPQTIYDFDFSSIDWGETGA